MLKSDLKVNALAWKAKCVGKSYGTFITGLSEEDRNQIFLEFEQYMNMREQEEQERLRKFKEERLASKAQKKKRKKEKLCKNLSL